MSDQHVIRDEHGPDGFYFEEQAKKATEVLMYVYGLRLKIATEQRNGRDHFILEYEPEAAGKVQDLAREIRAVFMVIRCFKVTSAFPTEMLVEVPRFPTALLNPDGTPKDGD